MQALKDPKNLALIVVGAVVLGGAGYVVYSIFGGRTVAREGTHINVVTGEMMQWSHPHYQDYVRKTLKTGRREIYPVRPAENGDGFVIHPRIRDGFEAYLVRYGLSMDEASGVVDPDTLRIRPEAVR